jgi:hypothetical protein
MPEPYATALANLLIQGTAALMILAPLAVLGWVARKVWRRTRKAPR